MIENLTKPTEPPAAAPDIIESKEIEVIRESTAANYHIVSELLKTNLNQKTIAKLTDYSESHLSVLKKKLSKIQLVTPKRIKRAIKSIEYISNSDNLKDDKIKASDVIAAAKIFIDRQYPITQVIVNHQVKHNLIDLAVYRNDTPADVIDVNNLLPDNVQNEDNSSSVELQVSSDNVSD